MKPEPDALLATRRDFLNTAGAALVVAAVAGPGPLVAEDKPAPAPVFEPVVIPDWVHGVTRMAFVTPGDVARAAKAGAQVLHTNLVWPYFPLHRDGGGLSKEDDRRLKDLVADCRRLGVKLVLGLPPFPPVAL